MGPENISVIVATRNAGAKVAKTIESVLAQDSSLHELIVIDAESTDETLDAVRRYERHLTLVSEPDMGIYEALNKGVQRATGSYLYFAGAGDLLRPGAFSLVAPRLRHDEPTLVYGNSCFTKTGAIYFGEFTQRDLVIRNVNHQSAFYSRSLFDMLGGFDARYRIAADWVFNIRCFADPRVRVEYIDEIIADYEGGGMSDGVEDPLFLQTMPAFLRETLGWRYELVYRRHRLRHRLSRLVHSSQGASSRS
jgi:glycosyltransferase involved in cell wall biosynthesis